MNVDAELIEKYRAHIGAVRVGKWSYKEPVLKLELVFNKDGIEQTSSGAIDLSVPGQVNLRLQEMRKQALR